MTRPEYMTTVLALIGPPSTGKTEMVRAAAQAQQAQYLELKGGDLQRVEMLTGLPAVVTGQDGKVYTCRAPNILFEPFTSTPGVVFLDEVNQVPPDGQGSLMGLFLDKRVGERQLHQETRVVCAMNPATSGVATKRLGFAAVSRMAQLWVQPTGPELSALHVQGYPTVPLAFDTASCLAAHRSLDAVLPAWWEAFPNVNVEEPPADWCGSPLPTARGMRGAIATLARLRAMPNQGVIMPHARYTEARLDAEHLVVGAYIGPAAAISFLEWERRLMTISPADILSGRSPCPTLTGAEAAAWAGRLVAEVQGNPTRWWDGGGSALAAALPGIVGAFGADVLAPHLKRLSKWATAAVKDESMSGAAESAGRAAFTNALTRCGAADLLRGA
jgi:hypothetical protein